MLDAVSEEIQTPARHGTPLPPAARSPVRDPRPRSPRSMLDLSHVITLYERYASDLRRVRGDMKRLYRRRGCTWAETLPAGRVLRKLVNSFGGRRGWEPRMLTQLDDIAAELTYLLLRRHEPEHVVEISPCHGWSSCWILSALRDNGAGELHSYDLLGIAPRNVPADLRASRWHFHRGDVRAAPERIPEHIDFLFMDSDHSRAFADWYVAELFPRVRDGGVVAVDDVFHYADPGQFDGEGEVVVDWLHRRSIPFFCASSEGFKTEQNAIHAQKCALGMASAIRPVTKNPTLFFEMRAAASS